MEIFNSEKAECKRVRLWFKSWEVWAEILSGREASQSGGKTTLVRVIKWDACLNGRERLYALKGRGFWRAHVNCILSSVGYWVKCYLFFNLWVFLRGLLPSSHINHTRRLILTYECPTLAWLVSCLLLLTYPIYLSLLGFLYFCISYFTSYSGWLGVWVSGCLGGCMAAWLHGWPLMSSSLVLLLIALFFFSPSI